MSVAYLFNVFIAASFAGWIYECIYCTIKTTVWQNRGFLFGPICPIYGFGFVGAKMIFQYLIPWLRAGGTEAQTVEFVLERPQNLREILIIFLITAAGSAVLEYSTSWLLEKLFHARWWDYSQNPFNLNGRICLPATLGFGAAGVLVIGWILPMIGMSDRMHFPLPIEELVSLALMFILSADVILSSAAAARLMERLESMESLFDEKIESTYEPIGKVQRAAAVRIVNVKDEAADVFRSMKENSLEWLTILKNGTKGTAGKMAGFGRNVIVRVLVPVQRNTLMNIVKYTSAVHQGTARRIREFLKNHDS